MADVADVERGLDNVRLNIAIEPHAEERPECDVEPGLLSYFPNSRFGGVLARLAEAAGDVPVPRPRLKSTTHQQQPSLVRDQDVGAWFRIVPVRRATRLAATRRIEVEALAAPRAKPVVHEG